MENKTVYRGNDTLFYNSQCLFVEYHDVIAMPWLTLLAFTKNSDIFNHILKMYEIADYDITGLLEWYVYRKHRNVFKSIGVLDNIENFQDESYDALLTKAMKISDDIYRIPTNLKFLSTLRLLLSDITMIKQVIIYSENDEPMIENTLKQYFSKVGNKVKYLHGNFEDMVKLVPRDSTYVISDIEKINTLIKFDKLNLSCILIPSGLRYNYMEEDATKLKIDMNDLYEKYIFKYSFFDNFDLTNALQNGVIPSEIESLNDSMPNDTK